MTRRAIDPTRRLGRALMRSAQATGCEITLLIEQSRPWHSATFTGARHEFTFNAVAGGALDAWLVQLPSADVPVPGHLVADIVASSAAWSGGTTTVLINVLTVADR